MGWMTFSSRRQRRVIGACVVGAAVALSLAFSGAAAVAAPPSCGSSGLDVWLNTDGTGAAGTIFYQLEFTNISGHTCTITGYPGVSAVNLAGHELGSAARRNPTQNAHTVTLASESPTNMAGGTASVTLGIVEAGNFSPSACHEVIAAGLRVYAPGQPASQVVHLPFGACSRTGPVFLNVEAAQKSDA